MQVNSWENQVDAAGLHEPNSQFYYDFSLNNQFAEEVANTSSLEFENSSFSRILNENLDVLELGLRLKKVMRLLMYLWDVPKDWQQKKIKKFRWK